MHEARFRQRLGTEVHGRRRQLVALAIGALVLISGVGGALALALERVFR